MRSARDWAAARGIEYRFLDDSFFNRCPDWYRAKVQSNVLLMSDLARLMVARELLDESFDRAIWIDADLLIFAPAAFDVQVTAGFAFCRELWVGPQGGKFVGWSRVNNAVCAFDRGHPFLDFYIDAAQRTVRQSMQTPDPLAVGTKFLTGLNEITPVPLIGGVGTLNPITMEHLSRGSLEPLREYRKKFAQPIAAANLCWSFRGKSIQGVTMTDAIYQGAVDRLLGDAGREISGI